MRYCMRVLGCTLVHFQRFRTLFVSGRLGWSQNRVRHMFFVHISYICRACLSYAFRAHEFTQKVLTRSPRDFDPEAQEFTQTLAKGVRPYVSERFASVLPFSLFPLLPLPFFPFSLPSFFPSHYLPFSFPLSSSAGGLLVSERWPFS